MELLYDGSFEGFLNCVYDVYRSKLDPVGIERAAGGLFVSEFIERDDSKAKTVARSIIERMGAKAFTTLRYAFWSERAGIEMGMLGFIRLGYKYGARVLDMLSEPCVNFVMRAGRETSRENVKYMGFLRFSVHEEVMFSTISPKANIIYLLASHFKSRFPSERFVIYDRVRRTGCVCVGGRPVFSENIDINLPDCDDDELMYRELFKAFCHNIMIKERKDTKAQMMHLPLRYRKDMVEFE